MPLDALAVRKMQCAAPILSVAVKGNNFSEVQASWAVNKHREPFFKTVMLLIWGDLVC